MRKKYPGANLYWLMGTDQWEALPKWNRPDHLASLADFIVFERGKKAEQRSGLRMHAIAGKHPASATAIRSGLSQGQHQDWLHPTVLAYILENGLYQTNPELHQADD